MEPNVPDETSDVGRGTVNASRGPSATDDFVAILTGDLRQPPAVQDTRKECKVSVLPRHAQAEVYLSNYIRLGLITVAEDGTATYAPNEETENMEVPAGMRKKWLSVPKKAPQTGRRGSTHKGKAVASRAQRSSRDESERSDTSLHAGPSRKRRRRTSDATSFVPSDASRSPASVRPTSRNESVDELDEDADGGTDDSAEDDTEDSEAEKEANDREVRAEPELTRKWLSKPRRSTGMDRYELAAEEASLATDRSKLALEIAKAGGDNAHYAANKVEAAERRVAILERKVAKLESDLEDSNQRTATLESRLAKLSKDVRKMRK
ncbi:uncharacterized protein B0H18DRAFT_956894 [Fomitopsis serialis]|uniref:uncharacterized protein n=1 Tax=Fomitopsis serialis TaxID=139415 RepID=UPI0020088F30|nr:uncharacterized protein B0H18DRAFT_956894 [Neoantrodia serialis]KAH9920758.1 hypothetical protein B0H18DRAFT_956894 [Neoantrodia serialis]